MRAQRTDMTNRLDPFVDVLADKLKAEIEKVRDGNSSSRGGMKNLMNRILLSHSFISCIQSIETNCPVLLNCCAVGGILC